MKKLSEVNLGPDIGHGTNTPNKDFGSFNEHTFNSDIAMMYMEEMINKYGFKTNQFALAQQPHSIEVPLQNRYKTYDGLDFYMSFHADYNNDPNANGVTIYHWKGSTLGTLLAEIFAAHYKMADMPIRFRAIDESDTDPSDGTWDNHGILREPYAPGIIIEHGFMSNGDDLDYMGQVDIQRKFAQIWAAASIDFLEAAEIIEPLIEEDDCDHCDIFDYIDVNENQKQRMGELREKMTELGSLILHNCPESQERQTAIQKLEECSMWANKSISRE